MTSEGVHGTVRERATVVAMILVGVALPAVANLPVFGDVVWAFWLATLVLIACALALVASVNRRTRRSRDS